ncbi:ATP-binding protein [Pandoraea sp. E26]|uniref:ATP-binding protein n=1 Tax=Pandoraea sp. E26 TaxID=1427365 RepID=UPI00068C604E|nr:ATP-binding protein [Pandoraea sp. E26]
MNTLKLKKLLVQSTTQSQASMFRFGSGLNLITGDDNSVGKSTLARLPLWAMGCDFNFDNDWKQHDARVILTFSVGEAKYAVARHRSTILLHKGNGEGWLRFEKVSGAYAREFAKIVGFGALLPRKKESWVHEVPPPAYYFSAFYVDQRRGWVEPWSSFVDHRYEAWRRPVISFHAGYHPANYYELGAEIARGQQDIAEDAQVVDKYTRAVEVLKLLAPPDELPATDAELDSAIHEIQQSMVAIKRREQRALASLSARREELEVAKVQRGIAEAAVADLEKDYDFAVNNLPEDTLVCPLCATVHDNSLLNRASILQDRQQASHQAQKLAAHQMRVEAAIANALRRLDETRQELSKLNRRFKRLDKDV